MLKVGEIITRNELAKRGWQYVCFFGYNLVYKKGLNKVLWCETTQTIKSFL